MEPVTRTFTVNHRDEEIQALEIIKEVLKDLDSSAQNRVMTYIQSWVYSNAGTLSGLAAGQILAQKQYVP